MFELLDVAFWWLHLILIVFNLIGWIWYKTRTLHALCIVATFVSWFIAGIWYGIGYCFLTDWHWQIKRLAGHTDLPNSFITYLFNEQMGFNLSPVLIESGTGLVFFIIIVLTVYVNIRQRLKTHTNQGDDI